MLCYFRSFRPSVGMVPAGRGLLTHLKIRLGKELPRFGRNTEGLIRALSWAAPHLNPLGAIWTAPQCPFLFSFHIVLNCNSFSSEPSPVIISTTTNQPLIRRLYSSEAPLPLYAFACCSEGGNLPKAPAGALRVCGLVGVEFGNTWPRPDSNAVGTFMTGSLVKCAGIEFNPGARRPDRRISRRFFDDSKSWNRKA